MCVYNFLPYRITHHKHRYEFQQQFRTHSGTKWSMRVRIGQKWNAAVTTLLADCDAIQNYFEDFVIYKE